MLYTHSIQREGESLKYRIEAAEYKVWNASDRGEVKRDEQTDWWKRGLQKVLAFMAIPAIACTTYSEEHIYF